MTEPNDYVRWTMFVPILISLTLGYFGGMAYIVQGHSAQPHRGTITVREYEKDIKDIKSSINRIERMLEDERRLSTQ